MTIFYNLDPLSAMELFYHGETNGICNDDFIKNEQSRDFTVPPILKEFLKNFGYLSINKTDNIIQIFPPDNICEIHTHDSTGEIPLLVIGLLHDDLLGLQLDSDELPVVCGTEAKEGLRWSPMKLNLSGLLMLMFAHMLFQCSGHLAYMNSHRIENLLARHNMEKGKIAPSQGCPQHFSINFNAEKEAFLIAEYDEEGKDIIWLHVISQRTAPKKS